MRRLLSSALADDPHQLDEPTTPGGLHQARRRRSSISRFISAASVASVGNSSQDGSHSKTAAADFELFESSDLSNWLESEGLADFKEALKEINGGEMMRGLTHEDLDRLGAPPSVKRRIALRHAVEAVKKDAVIPKHHAFHHRKGHHPSKFGERRLSSTMGSAEIHRIQVDAKIAENEAAAEAERTSRDAPPQKSERTLGAIRHMRRETKSILQDINQQEDEPKAAKIEAQTKTKKLPQAAEGSARHLQRVKVRANKRKNGVDPLEQFIREVNQVDDIDRARPLLWLQRHEDFDESKEMSKDRVIDPESSMMMLWQTFILVLVFLYLWVVPIRICYPHSLVYGSPDFIDANDPHAVFLWVDLAFDFTFLLDIFLTLNTAIRPYDAVDRALKVIDDRKSIRRVYLSLSSPGFYFAIDVVASFPVSLVAVISNFATLRALRVLKIFRLMRIFKLRRTLRGAAMTLAFLHNPSIYRLGKLIGVLVVVWHLVACLGFLLLTYSIDNVCEHCIGYVNDTAREPVQLNQCKWDPTSLEFTAYEMNDHLGREAWRFQPEDAFRCGLLADPTLFTRYSQMYYWAVMVTFGVGRDLVPHTDYEVWVLAFLILLGTILEAIIIGGVSSIFVNLDANETERRMKMESVTSWMDYRGVPSQLQQSILSYYDFLWSSSHSTNQSDMVSDLPPSLNVRLQLALYLHLIKKVPIFSQCKPDCVAFVITLLTPRICIPGEFVISEGEIGFEMFFVHRGRVQVLWEKGVAPASTGSEGDPVYVREKDVVLAEIGEGEFFGEGALTGEKQLRSASVKALTYCDLLVLSKDDLDVVSEEFPGFAEIVRGHNITRMNSEKRMMIINNAIKSSVVRAWQNDRTDQDDLMHGSERSLKSTGSAQARRRWGKLRSVVKFNAELGNVVKPAEQQRPSHIARDRFMDEFGTVEEGDEEGGEAEMATKRLLEIMGGGDPWLNGKRRKHMLPPLSDRDGSHWARLRKEYSRSGHTE